MYRAVLAAVILTACSGAPGGPMKMSHVDDESSLQPQHDSVETTEVLNREPLANTSQVKHILIGWNDGGDPAAKDPRAAKRTKKDAEDLIRTLMTQIKSGADFDALMKQYSEDPGSASSARAYTVSPDAQLVIEFKQLGLRLKVGEVGVVQSEYGFHIMKRVE
jgi:parvulin-like peptidyl-prolyl isomerase